MLASAEAMKEACGRVDELFVPTAYKPALGHEYRLDLDTGGGRLAPERAVQILAVRQHSARERPTACSAAGP